MFDLILRNGTIATASEVFAADIAVSEGIIVGIGRDLGPSRSVIEADGLLVMPGGVDSHVHCEQRGNPRGPELEDFMSASQSAACGGTTTMICFARQQRGEGILVSVEEYFERAKKSILDYSFHLTITDPTEEVLQRELPQLIREGHRSIKVFMTTHRSRVDDDGLLAILDLSRREGALVVVHAENHAATNWMGAHLDDGAASPALKTLLAKPPLIEREAVHRIVSFAELLDATIQIFHVTCTDALGEIAAARARGVRVMGETCPQYLLLSEDNLRRPDDEALRFVFGPPPRSKSDQDALWNALRSGVLTVVSSDHVAHTLDGPHGKRRAAAGDNAMAIPHGIPGVETRLPLLFSEGVGKGRISLNQFVQVTATNPARIFGLHPRKGSISVGADADLAIWDPHAERVIRNADLHHRVDYTPYEGMRVTSWPVITLSRGDIVWSDGRVNATSGRGRWLPRAAYDPVQSFL